MYKNFSVIIMLSCIAITHQIEAYTYKFENTTDKKVEISFKLAGINEPTETVTVPARGNDGKPGTASRSIGGWRIGLCFKGRDDLSMRILPDGELFLPLLLEKNTSLYDEFVETRKVPSEIFNQRRNIAKGDMKTAAERSNQLLMCFDRTFTIVETGDHIFLLIYE
jgi:hypothetical protein